MEVISTRKYEAVKPTTNIVTHTNDMIDPDNSIATVIKEEWETRKKKEITTTRQIETRVKRQVVLEDGEVIKDSGPLVTTNTTEDVEQQEHTTQEKRTNGGGDDDQLNIEWKQKNGEQFVQKELNETVVKSREEVEEFLETEDRRQFGDITDEAYQQAIQNQHQKDLRLALAESLGKSSQISEIGPRIIQHTTKSNKIIDTEKRLERKGLKPNGTIVTETQTSVTHEEISDIPDYSGSSNNNNNNSNKNNNNNNNDYYEDKPAEILKESSKKFLKKREEDIVDYVLNGERIARQKYYISETTEGDQTGDWPSSNNQTVRLPKSTGENNATNRKDALTKKPLDLEEEDEARKFETSKWLENHFGSESRSSHGSITFDHDDDSKKTSNNKQIAANTSFINVTMKSCTPKDRKYKSYNIPNHHDHQNQQQDKTYQENNYQQQQEQELLKQQHNSHHHNLHQQQTSYHYQYHKNQTPTGNSSSSKFSDGGYFQGISDWSERYRGTLDKQNNNNCPLEKHENNGYSRQNNSFEKCVEDQKNFKDTKHIKSFEISTIGRRHEYKQNSSSPPPPPIRRTKSRQASNREDKNTFTSSSPVQIIQRTWENRNHDIQEHERIESNISSPDNHQKYSSTKFRTVSPPPLIKISLTPTIKREKKNYHEKTDKSSRPVRNCSNKSKISESFKKFVDKIRSASTERKNNKKSGASSTSQLTQTDDNNSTSYLQYNVIDKNIPEIQRDELNNTKQPERPPRSPKNSSNTIMSNSNPVTKTIKVTRLNGHVANYDQYGRNNSITPVHRYYIEESVSGKNLHNRSIINNYGTNRKHGKIRKPERDVIDYNNVESASLGRLSKSTSRLTNHYDQQEDYYHQNHRQLHQQFTSTQTLPRKLHLSTNHLPKSQSQSTLNRNNRLPTSIITHPNKHHEIPLISTLKPNQSSRHYGSMINISIKNALSPSMPIQDSVVEVAPTKPERTYKSSLLRSKSFNVLEASNQMNGTRNYYSHKIPHKSSTQLNRLVDESPPLKSPSILASINRSNRDLFREDY
ncbi:transcription initiation factor TFIID subunit 1 [Chelonus insularis]|uniref:transcription initiation factor TFIID subunit 1 n=1 Tax=Chelonus insularis TaxID=460826 RepID=UPI00158C9443|nr:transcription initiation factor TFIID subunit 1 [Chelonus insularis]XP_034940859.1 transcription initiation factor TFIID subunit 1 [Chelonus insularis]XP_034940860.1 transcription initiation factor TFIID subunit 1 [Chelonus insularis]XP_034940861.1 transcription initiation factor TFIID subunit 1 [Chelonus insularis]